MSISVRPSVCSYAISSHIYGWIWTLKVPMDLLGPGGGVICEVPPKVAWIIEAPVPSGVLRFVNQETSTNVVHDLQKNILQLKSQFCREKVSFWSSEMGDQIWDFKNRFHLFILLESIFWNHKIRLQSLLDLRWERFEWIYIYPIRWVRWQTFELAKGSDLRRIPLVGTASINFTTSSLALSKNSTSVLSFVKGGCVKCKVTLFDHPLSVDNTASSKNSIQHS